MFKIIIVTVPVSAAEHAKCSNEEHLIAAHGEKRINSLLLFEPRNDNYKFFITTKAAFTMAN